MFGAGCLCQDPNLCPTFVLCPDFVLHMSCVSPTHVPFLSLSCAWPVSNHFLSSNSRVSPHIVQSLTMNSCLCPLSDFIFDWDAHKKSWDNSRSKSRLHNFLVCHLVTLHLDKNWTIFGLPKIKSLSTLCPSTKFHQNFPYITVFQAWTWAGQILDTEVPSLTRFCPS